MGKSSNRKKRAREFRAEHNLSKKEWNEMRREGKEEGAHYGSTPVVRYKWKKKKYPIEKEEDQEA